MKTLFLFLLCLCSLSQAMAAPFAPMGEPENLIIHNRILAKIDNKTISVMDVVKKMDVYLSRAYPQYANSKLARYQFYTGNWKDTLQQMIDDELMLLDSEGKDLKVTDGDVRESMQERFGPNVMGNLDRLGISYEEAKQMIYSELVVQKMLWFRIHSKALLTVGPQEVKSAYKEYCTQNPPMEHWHYQVLSIRSKNKEIAEELAKKAYERLNEGNADLAVLATSLKEESPQDTVSINVSEDYQVDEKHVSTAHKEVLFSLPAHSFSLPIPQVSRADSSTVFRIFNLKEHTKKIPLPLDQIKDKLENELIQKAIAKEGAVYISRLRERLGYHEKLMMEEIPDDFQPFALR